MFAAAVALALVALVSAAPTTGPGRVADADVTRRDAARAYVLLDRALTENPGHPEQAQEFDRVTRHTFRGNHALAVTRMLALADEVLPAEQNTPANRAARSLRAVADPPTVVAGEGQVTLSVRPVRDVPADAPPLTIRLRGADSARDFQTDPAMGGVLTVNATDLSPGRYVVEAVASAGDAYEIGDVHVVTARPSQSRETLLARLDALPSTADAALTQAAAALRARTDLLQDAPDPARPTAFLADIAALQISLAGELASLERGRDPYQNRAGDHWRTLDAADGPPLSIPARVYAPADALDLGRPLPLVIALHGAGGDENLFMDGYGAGLLKRLADERGFVAVSPLTYAAMFDLRSPGLIVDAMAEAYPIDRSRVYVVGHSLGAMVAGLWCGQRPDLWAGAGMIAGGKPHAQFLSATGGSMSGVPAVVAGAGFDRIFPLESQRRSAEAARLAGADVTFVGYADEGHVSVVGASLSEVVDRLLTTP